MRNAILLVSLAVNEICYVDYSYENRSLKAQAGELDLPIVKR